MYTVLIADDEIIIRKGLKKVVNWQQLGFAIIGEAANGEEALSLIRKHNPDIVLLDIRMPLMDGLDVIQNARAGNYKGKILILSGYSDFKYAQEAIRFGVKSYLTKPIDEEELTATLKALSEELREDLQNSLAMDHFREKTRSMVLRDLILGTYDMSRINYLDIHLTDNCYQVLICEKYCPDIVDISYNFSKLLKITNSNNNSFESINIENNEVIILKGNFSINKFKEFFKGLNMN